LNPRKYDPASVGITKLMWRDLISEIDFDTLMNYGITKGSDLIRHRIAEGYSNVEKKRCFVTRGITEANLLALYCSSERDDDC